MLNLKYHTINLLKTCLNRIELISDKNPRDYIEQLQTLLQNRDYSIFIEKNAVWLCLSYGISIKLVNELNSVSSLLLTNGIYENNEIKTVLNNLSNESVFFDVGANVGIYSLCAVNKYPKITVHAFEPVTQTHNIFIENINKNFFNTRHITLNSQALSNKNGDAFITTDCHSSNHLTSDHYENSCQKISTITLDEYVTNHNIKRIDLIKIDIEGHELPMLEGGLESLKQFKPKILIEISEKESDIRSGEIPHPREVIEFLTQIGYNYSIVDSIIHVNKEINDLMKSQETYHNYLFVPN